MLISQNTKIQINIYGSNLQAIFWKMQFGDKTMNDVPKADSEAFLDTFLNGFSRGDEEDEDDRFSLEVSTLDHLATIVKNYEKFRIEAWIELDDNGVHASYCILNHVACKQGYDNWNNHFKLSLDMAKIGSELQTRINSAIETLKGK